MGRAMTTKWTKELMFEYYFLIEKIIDNLQERRDITRQMDELLKEIVNTDDPDARPSQQILKRRQRHQKNRAQMEDIGLVTVLHETNTLRESTTNLTHVAPPVPLAHPSKTNMKHGEEHVRHFKYL